MRTDDLARQLNLSVKTLHPYLVKLARIKKVALRNYPGSKAFNIPQDLATDLINMRARTRSIPQQLVDLESGCDLGDMDTPEGLRRQLAQQRRHIAKLQRENAELRRRLGKP